MRSLTASRMPPRDQGGALQVFVWSVLTNTAHITHRLFAHLLCDRTACTRLQDALDRAVAEEF